MTLKKLPSYVIVAFLIRSTKSHFSCSHSIDSTLASTDRRNYAPTNTTRASQGSLRLKEKKNNLWQTRVDDMDASWNSSRTSFLSSSRILFAFSPKHMEDSSINWRLLICTSEDMLRFVLCTTLVRYDSIEWNT